jgi:hypothetical protein
MSGNTCVDLFLEFRGFEEKFPDLSDTQALNKIVKGTMLWAVLATAICLSASQELADAGGAYGICRNTHGLQESRLSLAEVRVRNIFERERLSHNNI